MYLYEVDAITDYMNDNDPSALANIIQQNDKITLDMRRFIADIVTGKLKRNAGKKPSTFKRNYEIYQQIDELLSDGYNLTSNNVKDGAGAIIADRFKVSEDCAIKAYSALKKVIEEINKENQE